MSAPPNTSDAVPDAALVPFGRRLAEAVTARSSQIVLGLDPDPARLWPSAERSSTTPSRSPRRQAADAVEAHLSALIEAAGPACVAVKPQLACFERLGGAGLDVLGRIADLAHDHGLLVLADGKRGDVPVTAGAYTQALLGETAAPAGAVAGLGADAVTVNPLLGRDALRPFVAGARAAGAGVYVLVRTSNQGAADVMDLPMHDGRPLWEHLAAIVDELGESGVGDGSPALSDVGAVTGATAPEHLARMRELMPRTPFLLPGVGAQGGDVRDLAPAFAPGRAAGLVTASRSIANAYEQAGGLPGDAARAEAERLRELAWGLSDRA